MPSGTDSIGFKKWKNKEQLSECGGNFYFFPVAVQTCIVTNDNQDEGSSSNLKIELLYDLAIPFLGTYPKDS